ncbi:hypothetical protein B0T20DRAFT_479196 [Sordaria brevicollis]|uniref:Uncharacterized protein n=1 Tax=Sordaria brevicollis TaxID=83679 RepID=A0AAE0UCH2_SORBR|nr:hypothetical protein B0T20DRAFT_479196 [Sordaria brevicollis]
MTETTRPVSPVGPGSTSKGSSSHDGKLSEGPSTVMTEATVNRPLLSISAYTEVDFFDVYRHNSRPHVPGSAARSSVFRSSIKTFFHLGLKPKWSTYSHFPILLLHWSFVLPLYHPANCDGSYYRCHHLASWFLDCVWTFILTEFWVFYQRAVLTAFHEYRRLLQQEERAEDDTQEDEAQACCVFGPVRPQQESRLGGLTTASEAMTFLRVLIAVELVFSLRFREFLYPTLAWLGYTYGSFNQAKKGSVRAEAFQAGPLERHMWRLIELCIMNWEAWLIVFPGSYQGGNWLWTCVAVHATSGLAWELKDHQGVDAARGDDIETGGAAVVEAAAAAVSSPISGPGPQNEAGSEFPEHHQSSVIEDIDTAGQKNASNDATATRTTFSVYSERGPRWFSAVSILLPSGGAVDLDAEPRVEQESLDVVGGLLHLLADFARIVAIWLSHVDVETTGGNDLGESILKPERHWGGGMVTCLEQETLKKIKFRRSDGKASST